MSNKYSLKIYDSIIGKYDVPIDTMKCYIDVIKRTHDKSNVLFVSQEQMMKIIAPLWACFKDDKEIIHL